MKKIYTRSITLVLLITLFISSFCYYAGLDISFLRVKAVASSIITRKAGLKKLIIDGAEYKPNADNEFRYNGHLYDIASCEMKDGKAIVTVYQDDKEELLEALITDCFGHSEHFITNGHPSVEKPQKHISPDLKYLCQQQVLPLALKDRDVAKCHFKPTVARSSSYAAIFKPPPDNSISYC